ncbi:LysM peptidoglycan-binding domain-containing protein [Prauserella muralis]|uniref:Uncharacterized protein n=1 Tax=Prauserella muralis TaxID=588067 RepID=A0A2V4AI27_9PSEU|nr:LysM peptidoglycan-binding domain-containing protein [Prauserella muralis]PXY19568.1 hypothetical protein BAY60_33100 [Prauserella muralis]TWE29559.1 LysM domain-containing protein [Prauserella muralis]
MSAVVDREAQRVRAHESVLPPRTVRRARSGETRRPPTRARVALRRPPARGAVPCGPRAVPYRWPLLAAVAAAVCLGVAGLGWLASSMAGAGEATVPASTAVVSVAPGDTLWDVAERSAPDSDPQAVVERIQELNGLTGADVRPGTPLVVPAGR